MFVGVGVGIGRQRFAGGFADSYSARVLADGGTIESLSCVASASALLQTASLLLIPSGYKAGVAYSALPNNGNGDLTWSRNSTANRTQSNGTIGSVGANVPRLSYMYGSCPALLLEPQRTNLDPVSQTFASPWVLTNSGGVTVSSVSATNPFGFSTVQKVIPSTTLGQHRPLFGVAYSAIGKFWVIAKADGYNFISLGEGGGVAGSSIIFDLSNGTISGATTGYTPEITPLGNGWYKCSINQLITGSSVGRFIIIRNNNTTADYSGNGTSGILIAHKQMEVGAYDTTAILTTGATATRLADTFTRNNIYTNGLISASGGTWFVELKNSVSLAPDRNAFGFWLGSSTTSPTASSTISFRQGGGSNRSGIWFDSTFVAYPSTDNSKIAIKWNGSTLDVFINGTKVSGSPFTFTPTLSSMQNLIGDAGRTFFIQQMALFNTPLSGSDCQLLTT